MPSGTTFVRSVCSATLPSRRRGAGSAAAASGGQTASLRVLGDDLMAAVVLRLDPAQREQLFRQCSLLRRLSLTHRVHLLIQYHLFGGLF